MATSSEALQHAIDYKLQHYKDSIGHFISASKENIHSFMAHPVLSSVNFMLDHPFITGGIAILMLFGLVSECKEKYTPSKKESIEGDI